MPVHLISVVRGIGTLASFAHVYICVTLFCPGIRISASYFSVLGIRIQWGPCVRIRNPDPDLDLRGKNGPEKNKTGNKFHLLKF